MAKSKSTGSHIKTPAAPAVGDRIEEQRQRLFKAMNAVKVTGLSMGEDDIARSGVLEDAHQLMDSIAGELCDIAPVMGKVVNNQDDDSHVRWPGYAPIDRAGAELAMDLLERLEAVEEGEIQFADLPILENWARLGQPYQNVLAEYVQRARTISPQAENAFLAVIGDLVALVSQGSIPDSSNYADMLKATGADDGGTVGQS